MTRNDDSGHSRDIRVTAGVTLNAVAAMKDQETFSRDQVAYIAALAYASGVASDAALSPPFAPLPVTPEQRVQQRIAEMEHGAERWRLRLPPRKPIRAGRPTGLMERDHRGRPVEPRIVDVGQPVDPGCEWPVVAAPGSGRPSW